MTKDKDRDRPPLPPGTSAALGDVTGNAGFALGLGRTIFKAVAGHQARRQMEETRRIEREEQARLVAAPPPVHGSARWASAADLAARDYLRPPTEFEAEDARNILLGKFPGGDNRDWLYWDGQGHLMTIAPTRAGKSTMSIVPNLLRYRGSCVVLDPKGELYRLTSKWRHDEVGPVYRIAPFEAQTHAFNPLSTIRSASDARALADLMIPEDPHASGFFRKDAIAFLNGAIQHVVAEVPGATMSEVRRITALPTDMFLRFAESMTRSRVGAVANAGNIVLGKARDRGLPNLRETINTELSVWDDDGVARATGGSDVDFHALKERPATVYITVPFHKMHAFAPFLKVLLSTALDAMVQNPAEPNIPVLFVLDEFLSLGPFPKFRDAIMTHAGAGVRLWFFLQNIAMLEEHYPTTWKLFFDAAVQTFFGTTDPFTARLISEGTDEMTVAQRTSSFTFGKSISREDFFDTGSNDSLNVTHSVTLSGRRLITPGEVVQRLGGVHPDKTRDAIINLTGAPPVMAQMVPYHVGEKAMPRIGSLP